mmetsp:Transcript_10652/g.24232  ORF Transcript_10652/g.24232 Transcript_10652/m.24232 type:complete len:1128 (-) Transcript_10652:48-3431(-)
MGEEVARVDVQDQKGRTALMFSACAGKESIVRALLAKRANVNQRSSIGLTPVMYSAVNGHEGVTQLLLKSLASAAAVEDTYGRNALMLAAAWGHTSVVRMLATGNSTAHDKEPKHGMTALMWASANGHAKVVEALLDCGASLEEAPSGPQPSSSQLMDPAPRASIKPEARESFSKDGSVECSSVVIDDDDNESFEEPASLKDPQATLLQRRAGLSSESWLGYDRWKREAPRLSVEMLVTPKALKRDYQIIENVRSDLQKLLEKCVLTARLGRQQHEALIDAFETREYEAGAVLCKQNEEGNEVFFVLAGAASVYNQGADGDTASGPAKPRDQNSSLRPGTFVRQVGEGTVVGEQAILWNIKRTRTVYADAVDGCRLKVAVLSREVYHQVCCKYSIDNRKKLEESLRKIKTLEMMTTEQLAKLADAMVLRSFEPGEDIIQQGEDGKDFFIVQRGECVVKIKTGNDDVQEHRRYKPGEMFGEIALLKNAPRAATVSAVTEVDVLSLTREQFERMLGPLGQLTELQYLADPRKLIADFYQDGDSRGPGGYLKHVPALAAGEASQPTQWFVVYRPTSREAIAKMLSGTAVGKGLNVKGKSAKQGVLSGLVPFLQISNPEHKSMIEKSPPKSRLKLYFRSKLNRDEVEKRFERLISEMPVRCEAWPAVPDKQIHRDGKHEPGCYGLDLPELLLRELYIEQADISTDGGREMWATGRNSEPAFMDMNLHAVRGDSSPEVVLLQHDEADPLNPRGLLIAYAEQYVKPVVSDFDTFLVGSRGMKYAHIPEEQLKIVRWSVEESAKILEAPQHSTWTSCWIDRMRSDTARAEVEIPPYGFGDPTSYGLIDGAIKSTIDCGAVRHGAECFNFLFPQELDECYLVVWDGFQTEKLKPWDYKREPELRQFLLERVQDGYTFPLNPVWPIRDPGWHEVWSAVKGNLDMWYPSSSGILERVEQLHTTFQSGFEGSLQLRAERKSRATKVDGELDAEERMVLGVHEVHKARLRAAANKVRIMCRMGALRDSPMRRAKTSPANGLLSTPAEEEEPNSPGPCSPKSDLMCSTKTTPSRVKFAEKDEEVLFETDRVPDSVPMKDLEVFLKEEDSTSEEASRTRRSAFFFCRTRSETLEHLECPED